MIPLCDMLNSFPGIRTTFCCFGHGNPHQFYIALAASNIVSLKKILKAFSYHYRKEALTYNIEAEWDGPTGNPCNSNEISIHINLRYCDYKNTKPFTIYERNKIINCLQFERLT